MTSVPDEDEVASARWAPVDEVRALIQSGDMMDGYSLTALLLYFSGIAPVTETRFPITCSRYIEYV